MSGVSYVAGPWALRAVHNGGLVSFITALHLDSRKPPQTMRATFARSINLSRDFPQAPWRPFCNTTSDGPERAAKL